MITRKYLGEVISINDEYVDVSIQADSHQYIGMIGKQIFDKFNVIPDGCFVITFGEVPRDVYVHQESKESMIINIEPYISPNIKKEKAEIKRLLSEL